MREFSQKRLIFNRSGIHAEASRVAKSNRSILRIVRASGFDCARRADYISTVIAQVPRVYAMSPVPVRLAIGGRLIALGVAGVCLTLLVLAAIAIPSPTGLGTHQTLGLNGCQFLRSTGLPCPSCGMTTSFAWFVRGNWVASFYVQPMGFVLAMMAAMTFWTALYVAISGKPAYVLLSFLPRRYTLLPLLLFGAAAWGWKIFIHLHGMNGWAK